VEAVFLLQERAWPLADVRDALTRAGLTVDDAALGRLVVSEAEHARVYVGVLAELDPQLREAFGDVEPARLLELEYASLPLLVRALESINVLTGVIIDNDHDFHGPLPELLARTAGDPEWDWRTDRDPRSA
jgi:hypothetical protein